MRITKKEIRRVVEMYLNQGSTENFTEKSKNIIERLNNKMIEKLSLNQIVEQIHLSMSIN